MSLPDIIIIILVILIIYYISLPNPPKAPSCGCGKKNEQFFAPAALNRAETRVRIDKTHVGRNEAQLIKMDPRFAP